MNKTISEDNITKLLVKPSDSIRSVIEVIDKNAKEIALVVDDDRRLLGTVTDGDIRRCILKIIELDSPVELIMQKNPTCADIGYKSSELLLLMNKYTIRHIPIINANRHLVDLVWISDLTKRRYIPAKAIIMAGGYGSRLRPLTNDTPKPMLKVWGKPILEVIIEHLQSFGVQDMYIATRYKAEKIKDYFKDGASFNLNISYIEEKDRLGTVGAVSLIKEDFKCPFIIINSDILTKLNFKEMYHFHLSSHAKMTVAVRKYDIQLPFGVVQTEDERIVGLSEKPEACFFVNAGVYILNPELKNMIPYNKHMDITELINILINSDEQVSSFPVREYWLDIGRFTDFEKAHLDVLNGNY